MSGALPFPAVQWAGLMTLYNTSTLTLRRPDRVLPMLLKAALERSITRPLGKLPLSLTRTTTLLPLARLVTRTMAPKGSVIWAAVLALFW